MQYVSSLFWNYFFRLNFVLSSDSLGWGGGGALLGGGNGHDL